MKKDNKKIEFTPEKLERLRSAYVEAVRSDKDIFTFDGDEFVVGYAKYVIMYLDSKFYNKSL